MGGKKLLNAKVVLHIIGSLITIMGVLMTLTIPFSLVYNDGAVMSLVTACVITLVFGLGLRLYTRDHRHDEIKKREGFLIVSSGWLAMSLCGTLPYLISGSIPDLSDAFFETMSGLTTTGATILGGDPELLGDAYVNKISALSLIHI